MLTVPVPCFLLQLPGSWIDQFLGSWIDPGPGSWIDPSPLGPNPVDSVPLLWLLNMKLGGCNGPLPDLKKNITGLNPTNKKSQKNFWISDQIFGFWIL